MTLDELLINHSAPTLVALKPASLFCLNTLSSSANLDFKSLHKKGLRHLRFKNNQGCSLLFVYRKDLLKTLLLQDDVNKILNSLGYDLTTTSSSLLHLRKRFLGPEFPHEVGLFLGYPVEDVVGFIQNMGKNYILSGLWKVYGNKENAEKTFEKYRKCSLVLKEHYKKGFKIDRLCVTA